MLPGPVHTDMQTHTHTPTHTDRGVARGLFWEGESYTFSPSHRSIPPHQGRYSNLFIPSRAPFSHPSPRSLSSEAEPNGGWRHVPAV